MKKSLPNETAPWTPSKSYSEDIIMQFIKDCNMYEKLASRGTIELIEEFIVDEDTKIKARFVGLEQLALNLKMLIDDTIFAIKPGDQDLFKEYYEYITKLQEFIELSKINKSIKKEIKLTIDEKVFNKILVALVNLKREIKFPLNRANLIFRENEEYDYEETKRLMMQELIEDP